MTLKQEEHLSLILPISQTRVWRGLKFFKKIDRLFWPDQYQGLRRRVTVSTSNILQYRITVNLKMSVSGAYIEKLRLSRSGPDLGCRPIFRKRGLADKIQFAYPGYIISKSGKSYKLPSIPQYGPCRVGLHPHTWLHLLLAHTP